MRLRFCGAARTVTGSKHLLELDSGHKILMDCGLFQGRRADSDRMNRSFLFDPKEIDVVLLSHAHIDHAGLLPKLWKEGFRGRIYATHATYSLSTLLLLDSAHIQEKDVRFINKLNRRRGHAPVAPLYERRHAEGVLEHFVGVGYRQPFEPVPGVSVEYRDAGHILGSATMVLTITEGGKTKRLGFTGDVGNPGRPILRDPQAMQDCDWLICESTYGGQTHEPGDRAKKALQEVIERTAARGGRVIIPAFAVGRTQEIVYALDQLWNEGHLRHVPVFVDSPLAVNATSVFLAHPECFDAELHEYMLTDDNPWGFDRLTYVRDVEKSKALNGNRVPMVILSASGMCEAGRILHHLRNNIGDDRNTVMMVGYCADHTLGKRIIEKRPEVRIFGEMHRLRAEVSVMNSFSAHADEPGILDFVGKLDQDRLQNIFLVHGAPKRQDAMAEAFRGAGYGNVQIPEFGETVRL
ncbi:MAG: MBL fold metallo-hydrolase [Rhodothermales bacterium]|nr:MBL fold metallo-hydrolase [Rhodothermales bacterium]MBO6779927.1 MBL fold metallo-hydrolase [Rhodothermales bacterium]